MPISVLQFFFSMLSSILDTAIDMDNLQPTLAMTMNEPIPIDQEFYHGFLMPSDTGSPASTVPLDEISSSETASIVVKPDCGKNEQRTRVSSRSLREVDYAYRAYKKTMDAATTTTMATPSKLRRSKPGRGKRGGASTDLDSMLDEFSQKFRRLDEARTDESQKLREQLEILNERNNRLQEEITTANGEKDLLREELIMSNHERDRLREEFTISSQQKDEKIRDLQRVVDERTNFTSLVCQRCEEGKTYWRTFGCGHVFCTGCISELNTKEPLFNSCCPCCHEPIQICINLDPKAL